MIQFVGIEFLHSRGHINAFYYVRNQFSCIIKNRERKCQALIESILLSVNTVPAMQAESYL